MIDIGLLLALRSVKPQSGKTWITAVHHPIGRKSGRTNGKVVKPQPLKQPQRLFSRTAILGQIVLVADVGQMRALFIRTAPGERVGSARKDGGQLAAGGIRQVGGGQKRLRLVHVGQNQPVRSEPSHVQKGAEGQPQTRLNLLIKGCVKPGQIDAQLAKQAADHLREIGLRRLKRFADAIADQQAPIGGGKLVALGMAAEIAMIVQDQDAGLIAVLLPPEQSRRQTADPTANHNQIMVFLDLQGGDIDFHPVPQGVGGVKSAGMAAAQTAISRDATLLGERLKRFRLARKLSLRDLGERTGTTASFLSQLERGASGAAVSTLIKIAEALAVSVADFFEDRKGSLHCVLRRGDRQARPQAEGYHKTLLSQQPIRNFEVYVGFFDAGGSTGPEAYTDGDSHEMMFVLRGEVEITLAGTGHRMSEGDCIEYRSSTPHRLVNIGAWPAEVQWIISPVTSAKADLDEFSRKA